MEEFINGPEAAAGESGGEVLNPGSSETVKESAAPESFKFKARGEEREVSLADTAKVQELLSKGYDYNHLVAELKQEKESYKELIDFAKNNPDWAEKLKNNFASEQSNGNMSSENQQNSNLDVWQDYLNFKQGILEERRIEQEKAEDAKLDQEIASVREKFNQVDFSATDDKGQSLEVRILEHAHKNGLGSYEIAAKDYLFNDMLKLAEERGKETVSKAFQKSSKLGLLSESKAPNVNVTTNKGNLKSKSYSQLMSDAYQGLVNK